MILLVLIDGKKLWLSYGISVNDIVIVVRNSVMKWVWWMRVRLSMMW